MNENASINSDETRMEQANQMNENEMKANAQEEKGHSGKRTVKSVVTGGLGMMAGVVGSMGLMAFREAPQVEAPDNVSGSAPVTIPEPETLEEIEVAHTPADNMSFNEAFASAREEVGSNGVFQWRGGVYGTYYANEWENFSDEYKEKFNSNDWRSEFPDAGNDAKDEVADAGNDTGSDVAEDSFGGHAIHVDENGEQYISLQDAITGEEVRISPDDLQYAVLDERNELIGVIGKDALASVDGAEDGYMLLDDEGNLHDFVSYENDAVELLDSDEDGVVILNGADDVDDISPDMVDDDAVVIDGTDEVGIYLVDNDLPDYVNDAPVDDFIV